MIQWRLKGLPVIASRVFSRMIGIDQHKTKKKENLEISEFSNWFRGKIEDFTVSGSILMINEDIGLSVKSGNEFSLLTLQIEKHIFLTG